MNPLDARRRLLGRNVYKKTVEGNPAIAQGSLARMYPGITMQGWTEQAQYEGKNLLDNLSSEWNIGIGLSWGAGYDTPISVNAEQKYRAHIIINEIKPNTKYSFKNLNKEKIWVDIIIVASDYGNGITNIVLYNEDYNHDEYTFTTINDEKVKCVYFQVRTLPLEDGSTVPITEENIKNMKVCFNEGDPTYEPYTGGQPSPNPDYPQEIVSAGKYNEDTQKREYEITIANAQTDATKNQTVTLTSDRQLTKWDRLEKRNGQWGWVYKSDEYIFDNNSENLSVGVSSIGEEINSFYAEFPNKRAGGTDVFSNKFKYDYGAWAAEGHLYGFSGHPVSALTYFEVSKDIDTYTAFRDWMIENQVSVLYETESETFVPLSESEQEQMNALHTFRPTTVLSNDCDCNMSLAYKTKKSLEVTD